MYSSPLSVKPLHSSKTYSLEFPSLAQCELLNESEDYVRCHGKTNFTKKVLDLIDQRYVVKCKGFTLKENEAKNTLTFEQIVKLMDGEAQKQSVRVPQVKWDRSGNDTVRTVDTTKKFSVPVAGNAKRVRLNPTDEFCLQYPWGHDMVPEGSPAYAAARRGLVIDGRIKAKTDRERQEFRDIREHV